MDFSKTYILEDDGVLLKPLTVEDYEHLRPFAINEPETWKYSAVSLVGEQGCTRFYDIQLFHQTTQLGYTFYAERSRGTGINKRCKYLLLKFAFETLNMERVEFRADLRNERSIAAMKSIGCTPEGVLRQSLKLTDGNRRDSIILSILKSEWYNHVKESLKNRLL